MSKMHLWRSSRSTWCGRDAAPLRGGIMNTRYWTPEKMITHNHFDVTCKTCLKANAAEQRREDEASKC